VRHHADGCAAPVQFAHQFHHAFTIGRIEVARRLIREQDTGLSRDRSRDSNALLLTS
jgi:hypothetical protein